MRSKPSAGIKSYNPERFTGAVRILGLSLALVAFGTAAYLLLLPLVRSRGKYGWGFYSLTDLVFGIPCAIFGLLLLAILGRGKRAGPGFALKFSLLVISATVAIAVADFSYTMCICQVWRPGTRATYWFDQGQISRRYNVPDDELGFVRLPNLSWRGRGAEGAVVLYQTDLNGFRNPAGIRSAPIVFVGDSFTEGASVPEEQTFVQRVQRLCGETSVNLGRGFYGPQQELIVLKRYGLACSPRFVVWQIFEGNDLADARRFAEWRDGRTSSEPFKLRYVKASPLAQVLSWTIRRDSLVPHGIRHSTGELGRVFLDYRLEPNLIEQESTGMLEMKRTLAEGLRLARAQGFQLLIMLVPIKVRILGPYILFENDRDREFWLPPESTKSPANLAEEIADQCRELGCDFLDLTAALQARARADSRFLYASNEDTHLAVEGHRIVADEVASWLRKQGLGEKSSHNDYSLSNR